MHHPTLWAARPTGGSARGGGGEGLGGCRVGRGERSTRREKENGRDAQGAQERGLGAGCGRIVEDLWSAVFIKQMIIESLFSTRDFPAADGNF